jgi:Rne/Rng family ribonuclease
MLLEDGAAVGLWAMRAWARSRVGELHLARVVRLLPALPGAFVALAGGGEALLSEEDARDLAPEGREESGIAGWLQEGAAVLVQVHRDAAHGKAPGVRARIALAGERLDLLPTATGIRFGRGVPAEIRAEITALLPPAPGVRVRNPVDAAALVAERETLLRRWEGLRQTIGGLSPPALLDRPESDLATLFEEAGPGLAAVRAADPRSFAALRGWLRRHDERLAERLARDETAAAGIEAAFAEALAPAVPLPGGGRLATDLAAAATLIDVDLGAGIGEREGAARRIVAANRVAAAEAARQIRLRGLAGPIVIDFVSMRHPQHRDEVRAALAAAFAGDPAEPQLLGWTRLGHFELTRRRRRAPLHELLLERTAEGGWRASPETTALAALRQAARQSAGAAALKIGLGPEAAAALAGKAAPAIEEFREIHGFRPEIIADPTLAPEAVDIRRG